MIGNLIGAFIGERAGEHSRGINGPAGALIGAGAVGVIKRVSPIALLAAGERRKLKMSLRAA